MHRHLIHHFGHVVGGTFLVAGITLGVGMLALPLATAETGFIPSIAVFITCWLFMVCTGLLTLEACAWMPKEANFITMAEKLLGWGGKIVCWILYLFLFSCIMVAHIAGGGHATQELLVNSTPLWGSILLYTVIFFPVVYLGVIWVDRLNLLLIAAVLITYLIFIGTALPHINFAFLEPMRWSKVGLAVPVVFTAFGYQTLIPTLLTYMDRDCSKVKKAILFGTSIPLLLYLVWQFVILGILPKEELVQAMQQGKNAVGSLGTYLQAPFLNKVGQFFAFFVMTTSFIGIATAFVDFLVDGLKVKKKGWAKASLCIAVFFLPALITICYPQIFFAALSVAGGIGIILLLGAMPIAMVWQGRYHYHYSLDHKQLPGGKPLLLLLMAFVVIELLLEFSIF